MLSLYFINSPEKKYDVEFSEISEHIVQLKGELPQNTSGFYLSRIGYDDRWDYSAYTTIYKVVENNVIQFSNDGSKYEPPKKTVKVSVLWNDDGNSKGKRPASVSVTVFENGKRKNILTLKKQNNWEKIYENIPMEYVYTVEAKDVAGYSKQINETTINYTIMEENS